MKPLLDRVVREARGDLGVEEARGVDWGAVDEALFERLDALEAEEEERASEVRAASRGWRGRAAWAIAGAGMAAAVTLAMLGGRPEGRLLEAARPETPVAWFGGAPPPPGHAGGAATLLSGDAVVGGAPAGAGAELRSGDAIEARGAVRADAHGKALLLLEAGSSARVTSSNLVLALERGAIEADVSPVTEGEAFAVDVGRVRVAVHGTHLRVARIGERVTVDLSEGVVSVGEPPRVGSTMGPLVTAPAHVEFSIDDLAGTLAVSHDARAVREPVALRPGVQPPPVIPASPVVPRPGVTGTGRATPPAARVEPRSLAANDPSASAPPAAPLLPAVDSNAEATLAAAVRSCMPARTGTENVTVSMSTTLRLELEDSGMVRSARFDPPVAVSVNECSAPTIYKTRFSHGGAASVSIDVTVPSSPP